MQLTLTVVDPLASGRSVDCVVDAPPGSRVGDVMKGLLHAVGRGDGLLFCAGAEVSRDALLGHPPLVEGAVLTLDHPPGAPSRRSLLELHVTAGPDAGSVLPVGAGEHSIGRGAAADLRLDDPDLSRRHALVRLGAAGATVVDLDSTNGSTVDGRRVDRDGDNLYAGAVLHVGGSRLELVAPQVSRASVRADGEGRLQVNRPPRLIPPSPAATVRLPVPPTGPEKPRLPVIALVVPLVAGGALVAFTRNPFYLLFVLLSPLMVLGTFVSDKVAGRRSARTTHREYDEALAKAHAEIDASLAAESAERHQAQPGPATLMKVAEGPQPRLWERRRSDGDF